MSERRRAVPPAPEGQAKPEAVPRRQMGPQPGAPRGETIDAVIDHAVREMMNVDADPAFRARVLERIDRPAAAWLRSARFAAAGAAVVAVVLAFVLTRTSFDSPAPGVVGQQAKDRGTPTLTPRPSEPRAATTDSAASRRPRLGRGLAPANATQVLAAGALIATIAAEHSDPSIESLDPIQPIALQPIRQSDITPAPIEIAPLTPIAQLEIAPMSTRSERNEER